MNSGFLGTAAPLSSDLVLLLEISMGLALGVGAWLARTSRYRAHAWCQSALVLANLALIALAMVPAFRLQVLPRLPRKWGKRDVALAAAHGTLGTVSELAALYILVAAGTRLLPEKMRLTRYKAWMRGVLVLWWLVVLLGVATYARWYLPHRSPRARSQIDLPVPPNSSSTYLLPVRFVIGPPVSGSY